MVSINPRKAGETMQDRRIFTRFNIELPVKFLLQSSKEGLADIYDVSAKGVGLVSDEPLMCNTVVEMWLEGSDKHQPLYVRGRIAWVKETELGKYRAGINLDKADFMGLSHILRAKGMLR